ncbi:hypothetical protein D3C72_1652250 [compost metagenome]
MRASLSNRVGVMPVSFLNSAKKCARDRPQARAALSIGFGSSRCSSNQAVPRRTRASRNSPEFGAPSSDKCRQLEKSSISSIRKSNSMNSMRSFGTIPQPWASATRMSAKVRLRLDSSMHDWAKKSGRPLSASDCWAVASQAGSM